MRATRSAQQTEPTLKLFSRKFENKSQRAWFRLETICEPCLTQDSQPRVPAPDHKTDRLWGQVSDNHQGMGWQKPHPFLSSRAPADLFHLLWSAIGSRNLLRLAAEVIDCTPTSIRQRPGLATASSPPFDLSHPASRFYDRQSCLITLPSSNLPGYSMIAHFALLFHDPQSRIAPRLSPARPHYMPILRLVSSVSHCQFDFTLLGSLLLPHDSAIVNLFSPFYDRHPGVIILRS
jgi:hypothetical protein